jgi:murein DD-endopeptidase MepM/ murein hydrolase activator NlpD
MDRSVFGKRGVPWVLLGCSVILNGVLLVNRGAEPQKAEAPAPKPAAAAPAAQAPQVPAGPQIEWQQASAQVTGTLERTFTQLLGPELGPQLSQTYARLFVWDVSMRTELSPKDNVDVIYRELGNNEIDIAAARLHVAKKTKTYKAYKWQAPGDKFASWWNEEGVEVPMTLKNAPIKEFQQVTSLVGDGRGHAGMDFKAPVGTEVFAPFAGTVTRSNWNFQFNGNSIEVQTADGLLIKFLHLSENKVKAGDVVQPGQLVGLVGNTGRSFAPHLHYQINQGAKLLDPVAHHGTFRRQLDAAALAQFKPLVQTLDAQLAPKTAGL